MARYGYIIYPNAGNSNAFTDTNYTWATNKVIFTSSSSHSLYNITAAYVGDNMQSSGLPNFTFPDTPSSGTSTWMMYNHDAGEGNDTSLTTLTNIASILETYVTNSQYSDWEAILNNTGTYPHHVTSTSNVTVSSTTTFNNSTETSDIAGYNWSTVDTSTYNYPSDFAAAMSGNEYDESHFWATSSPHDNQSLFQGIDYTNIPSNDLGLNRTDLMFVQEVLKNSTGIQDEVKLALSFLLAYAKSSQANTKLLTKNFNKTRSVMNITNLQTLENDYRKG